MLGFLAVGPFKPEAPVADRRALERLQTAIVRGIGWFRVFYPNKIAHLVLDEATFLIPNPSDSEAVKTSKRICFDVLLQLAIRLGLDSRSCQVVMTSSTPEIFDMGIGTAFARSFCFVSHLVCESVH